MRNLWNILRVLVVIGWLAGMLILPRRAFACSCMMPGTPALEMANSAAVFAGEVTNVENANPLLNMGGSVRVTFKVSEVWKGPVQGTLVVETTSDGASCGYGFAVGQKYLVYAYNAGSQLATSICSRTAELSAAAQDLVDLGQGSVPAPSAQTPTLGQVPILIAMCGVLVLLTLGAALFAYRRMTRQSSQTGN